MKKSHRFILIGIFAVALAARLIHLNRGIWIDELVTWSTAHQTWDALMRGRLAVGHLPFYFVLVRPWIQLSGTDAAMMRLSSVAFGMGTVVFTYLIGRGMWRREARLLAAAILALHAGALWCSQTIRPYEMLAMVSVLSGWVFLNAERGKGGRWMDFAVFATTAIGMQIQVLFAFVVAGQILFLAWYHGRGMFARNRRILIALALGVLTSVPINVKMMNTPKNYGELSVQKLPFNMREFKETISGLIVGEYKPLDGFGWIYMPSLALAVIAGAALTRGSRGRARLAGIAIDDSREADEEARKLVRYLVCWVGMSAVLFMFLTMTKFPHRGLRYFYPVLPGIACSLAGAAMLLPNRLWRGVYVAALAATMLPISIGWLRYPGDGLCQAIEYIESRRAPQEFVLGAKGDSVSKGYQFYRPQAAGQVIMVSFKNDWPTVVKLLKRKSVSGPFWLIVYHNEKNPPLDPEKADDDRFTVLERQEFNDARVLHIGRKS